MSKKIPAKCAKCGADIQVEIDDGCDQEFVQQLLRIAKCNRCKPPRPRYQMSEKQTHQPRLPHAD